MHYTKRSDGFMHGFKLPLWFALWTSFCGLALPWGFVIPALWMPFCGVHISLRHPHHHVEQPTSTLPAPLYAHTARCKAL